MRPLKLHPRSADVLADWRKFRSPSEEDERIVEDVLRAISNRDPGWKNRWHRFRDISDRSVTIIQPRPDLYVCVRLWTDDPDYFELVRIIDQRGPASQGEERIWENDAPE